MIDEVELEQLAAEGAVRLLIVEGRHIWEASPSPAHQMIVDDIRASIRPAEERGSEGGCGCYHLADTNLTLTPGAQALTGAPGYRDLLRTTAAPADGAADRVRGCD